MSGSTIAPGFTRPIGVSRDFLGADGRNVWGDIGLDGFEQHGLAWEYLEQDVTRLRPADLDGRPAVVFAEPAVTAASLAGVANPPLVLARFGVGYDAVDVAACSRAGIAVTITPDGAQRPVATAALALLLGAMLNLGAKDRLVRRGTWGDRTAWMGRGLTGATVGIIGFGSTATDFARLLAPFKVTLLASDPYCPPERAAAAGAELVSPGDLARRSDAVVVMALLTEETRHLVDAGFLAAMKAGATLVNVARGPIVDEAALAAALASGSIRAAALDVFETEPLPMRSPLVAQERVLLSPHSAAWTDEMSLGNGRSAVRAVLDALAGRTPRFTVDRAFASSPAWNARLAARRPPEWGVAQNLAS
ncbi:NAD(P)-dependent oxidoreductase [Agromyces archimandritae]|uniref:Dehydrogenase n=1 Tax=Agromyces archimandritae TaxID=2781962 RepID=A0A975FPX6_9MICO|nr:NAD(P)-dependent oxidoreductase [Agromyces archimandritae]QTX05862.1 dehydrogenase [Agromyces archimandritae]